MWWSLLAVDASAQSFDAHGSLAPVSRGVEGDPLFVWTPPAHEAGRVAVGLGLDAFDRPLLVTYGDVRINEGEALLGAGLGLSPHLRWSLSRRFELAASWTVYPYLKSNEDPGTEEPLDTILAAGDALVAAPVALWSFRSVGLGLVPAATLPVGTSRRWVGEPGPEASLSAALEVVTGAVAFHTSAGGAYGGVGAVLGQERGHWSTPAAVALGLRLAEPIWVRVEARAEPSFGGRTPTSLYASPSRPFEAFLGVGGPLGRGWGVVQGGRGLTDGVGAAAWRVAGDATLVVRRDPASTGEGVPALEAPALRVRVTDPSGIPVAGAELQVDGFTVATTGADGVATLEDAPRWNKGVRVVADRFEAVAVAEPEEGVTELAIALDWTPATLDATVRDTSGNPIAARLVATSLTEPGLVIEGAPGAVVLPGGSWRVEVAAEGLASQVRRVEVDPRLGSPDPLDVVLAPVAGSSGLSLVVTDPEGRAVDGARILVDGVPVGTTSSGGALELTGLAAGQHQVEVLHDAFTGVLVAELDAEDGAVLDVPVALQRVPGSVKVTVRDGLGRPVEDAVVRFVGPRRLPAMAVGPRGERVQVLGAGEWQVVVTSAEHGAQERTVEVPPDRYELIVVEVVLQPDELGTGELVVRLVDPSGEPVEGARISLDEVPFGTTSTGGTLELGHLQPGVRTLGVELEGLRPFAPQDLVVAAGRQERVVKARWLPGVVDLVVRGPEGPVQDARVRLLGEQTMGPDDVGPTGRRRSIVTAGQWTALVTSGEYGVQEREFEVLPDEDVRHVIEVVLTPSEGGLASLAVRVVGPDDQPVDGAGVWVDGDEAGRTSNLGTLKLTGLDVGPRELEVRAEPYATASRRVKLFEGLEEVEVPLEWDTGAVEVRVHHGAEPVTDAFVRFLGEDLKPAAPVDADGLRRTRLDPGLWLVVATSPTAGVGEWDLEVPTTPGLSVVDLDLTSAGADRADLLVQVVDPDGRPIEDAEVWLDGTARAGDTQQGGVVLARSLPSGTVKLTVKAPDFLPSEVLEVELVPGTVERIVVLEWLGVPVVVRAVDPQGAPIDAQLQWVGPGDAKPVATGVDGEVETRLPPGAWRVIARAGDLSGEAALALRLGDEPRPLEVVLTPTNAVLTGEHVVLREQVHFDFGLATLRPDSDAVLDQVARVLSAETELVRLEVQGHTDNVGAVPTNQELSQRRAEAVVAALVARGVAPEKLVAVGYGPTRPIASNAAEEGRATNRRVQFEVLERGAGGEP